ncbi:MAG: transcriptional regulator [Candidatus Thermoplasmatota archaeon]
MNRDQLLQTVRETLNNSGFYVSEICSMRPIGFDLVARRDNSLLIIKVLTNIDAFSEEVAKELLTLSKLLKASPLLIGEKSAVKKLEEDVIYYRFNIPTITSETLKNHLLEGIPLEVYAAPGGLYVQLDHDKLSELREKKKISLGSFARSLKVSRRTVKMYEDGMNARVDVAIRIEELVKEIITKPIDLLKPRPSENQDFNKFDKNKLEGFQREILSKLEDVGYKVIPMIRCPFEAVSKDNKKVLLTCVSRYDKKLLRKAHTVGRISKIAEKHAVLITDRDVDKSNIEGTPLIVDKELKKLRGPEEIIELIVDRVT